MLMLPNARKSVITAVRTLTSELSIPVSVKLRIGVDDHDSLDLLLALVEQLHAEANCAHFVVPNGLPNAQLPNLRDAVTPNQNRLQQLVRNHIYEKQMCSKIKILIKKSEKQMCSKIFRNAKSRIGSNLKIFFRFRCATTSHGG